MKYKASNRVNQRIERISPKHILVGIDIAKETHVAAAVNFRGIEIGRKLSFDNNRTGFENLLTWVGNLKRTAGLEYVLFGMESTGHYFLPLAQWLQEREYEVALVNPLTTKRNKENRDNRPSKSDAKDALVIAECVSRGFYSEWTMPEPIYHRLRCQVNEREALGTDLAALSNQLQTLLDQVFPEFRTVFKEWHCPRGLATLKAFPLPDDLQERTAAQIVEEWRKQGMKRAGGQRGLEVAGHLLTTAHGSVGLTESTVEMRQRIGRLVRRYEQVQADITAVEAEIEALLQQVPQEAIAPHKAIGLGTNFTAAILANTGDLRQYEHGQQVIALAGLSLAESQSGKRKGQIVLSKRGRRQLRKYLYLAVMNLVANHTVFKMWHQHNVEVRGMKKQRSLFKLIGKLARILVALAHSGEAFDSGRAASLPIAA